MEPILASPLDLVLVDEAAAIREPDIIQCFNRARSGATCVQIGDDQQLRPVVNHPENKADNDDTWIQQTLVEPRDGAFFFLLKDEALLDETEVHCVGQANEITAIRKTQKISDEEDIDVDRIRRRKIPMEKKLDDEGSVQKIPWRKIPMNA